jgi:hypothetical protein
MKTNILKCLSVMLILSSVSGITLAERYEDSSSCAPKNCYECACNPLYCGATDIQIQAGVVPVSWRQRGSIYAVNCASPSIVNQVLELPKFNKLFKTPWTVGGQLAHAWSDNSRVYLEVNYVQAKAKSGFSTPFLNIDPVVQFAPVLSKYRLFDVYVGARYYWDRWCDRVSFFLGGKIGFASHRRINFSQITPAVVGGTDCSEGFCSAQDDCGGRHSVVAGGANIGLDICICGGVSFVITGEVVGSCAPHTNPNIVLGIADSFNLGYASNLLIGSFGNQLRFPVTFGIRYTF